MTDRLWPAVVASDEERSALFPRNAFVVDDRVPPDEIWLVPTRRENETEEEWATRIVRVKVPVAEN